MMPLAPEWQKFIQPMEEVLRRRSVPQDKPTPPRPPLTEAEKEVASLLKVVSNEQLRRWANDLPRLTQEEQDSLVLRTYKERKGSGLLKHI